MFSPSGFSVKLTPMIAVRPQIPGLFQKSGILLLHWYFELNRCRNHKASKGNAS
ncbi:MAG: hypothetical protein V7K41_22760 [Nostoc sp.]|uniref:hypothetical protein n=1 Tax=Nostoc sp. TaxID=1180 RepID=UPI002FFC076F